jgi:3-oxoacyl-ACP reductase-like protein
MGIFGSILSKLGIGDKDKAPTPTAGAPAAPGAPAPGGTAAPAAPAAPAAVPVVDVEAHMERLAAATGHEVNWRHSIVDLLSLLDIDNSYAARKELAVELGCPPELMDDSAQMNVWLHKTVMARIAANGGKVPQNLLD